jgi:hypothetical protein
MVTEFSTIEIFEPLLSFPIKSLFLMNKKILEEVFPPLLKKEIAISFSCWCRRRGRSDSWMVVGVGSIQEFYLFIKKRKALIFIFNKTFICLQECIVFV